MGLGVADTSIKVVSLGEEGSLCADISDTCSRMNRRVHLEFRNVGAEHLVPPADTAKNVPGQDGPSESSTVSSSSTGTTESTSPDTPADGNQSSSLDQSGVAQ